MSVTRSREGAPVLVEVPCPACGAVEGSEVARAVACLPPGDGGRYPFRRCDGCGLVRSSPRVPDDALDRFYGEDYLPHRGPAAWGRWAGVVERSLRRTARTRAALVARVADPGAQSRVLDVGCGRPLFLRELRDRTGCRVVGVDRSDRGWRDSAEAWEGIDLHAGGLDDVRDRGPFDVVTLWHVLEHVFRPVELLEELRGSARPGTTLVVEVPDHSSWTRRVQGPFWAGYDAPRHAVVFDPATLRGTLERAGWEVAGLRRRGTLDPWVFWWLGREGRRGRSLGGSLEARFPGFVLGKLLTLPLVALTGGRGLGLQTAVARAPA